MFQCSWEFFSSHVILTVLSIFENQSLSYYGTLFQNTVTYWLLGLLIFDLTTCHQLNQFPQNCKFFFPRQSFKKKKKKKVIFWDQLNLTVFVCFCSSRGGWCFRWPKQCHAHLQHTDWRKRPLEVFRRRVRGGDFRWQLPDGGFKSNRSGRGWRRGCRRVQLLEGARKTLNSPSSIGSQEGRRFWWDHYSQNYRNNWKVHFF